MKKLILAFTVFTLVMLPLSAMAFVSLPTVQDFTICDGNSALDSLAGSYPPPYAFVKITVPGDGSVAVFEVTAANSYTFGGNQAFDVIFSEAVASVTFDALAPISANPFAWTHVAPPGDNVSDFGRFTDIIEQGNMSDPATSLTFTVTPVDGSFADAASVLLANSDGYFVAMHIKLPDTAGTTGFAGNCTPTPIPGSLLLMGSGILGLVGLRRKMP
jgi:hypothetical protein